LDLNGKEAKMREARRAEWLTRFELHRTPLPG